VFQTPPPPRFLRYFFAIVMFDGLSPTICVFHS
jgi:hypothetical protein